jgi:hypothetical protein
MPEDSITEKFSENPPAKKRGRPRRFLDGAYPVAAAHFRSVRTERGQLNMRYAVMAISQLSEDGPDRARYEWICPDGAFVYCLPHAEFLQEIAPKLKTTLLAELGRISADYGKDTMRKVALQLCEEKPQTRDALRWVRALRLQKPDAVGTADALLEALEQTINDFELRYPATPTEEILSAVTQLCWSWEDFVEDFRAHPEDYAAPTDVAQAAPMQGGE